MSKSHTLDRILINDLSLRAIVGVNPDERVNPQDVTINVALCTDTRTPGASDDIEDAVNYGTVAKRIVALVEASSFMLLERLAEEIAQACLEDARVEGVSVRIDKPRALRYARSAAVEIHRSRADH